MKFSKGDKVRWNYNGKDGLITGAERGSHVEVKFNEGEYRYINVSSLELVSDDENALSRFEKRWFAGIDDFRRALNRYRLSGMLTDIMYSMSNTRTEFFPHQFVPVTKFLESYTGRLLVADEVGLGKTIESMYIWEELRARVGARRLLIVVPAVLRNKWKHDLDKFFNIDATIVHAQGRHGGETLLSRLQHVVSHPGQDSFVYIVSLEGLRTAHAVEGILEENADVRNLFDMVIIDEAHYMRNSNTRSFKLGAKLRDVSEHLLLLSATPIQTSSENLYNLLKLLGPEEFDNQYTFDYQLKDLVPFVRLTNSLEGNAPAREVRRLLKEVLAMPAFDLDADCRFLESHMDEVLEDTMKRISLIKRLKSKFFYDPYITRTRKRDVMENRTARCACSVKFRLTRYERNFYDEVTEFLKTKDDCSHNSFSVFRLIVRQRQMASCMPAALMSWRGEAEIAGNSGSHYADDFDEERSSLLADITGDIENDDSDELKMPIFPHVDLKQLIARDSKFNAILAQIRDILSENPSEKIVIFSFFRSTVAYLNDRFRDAGISTEFLIGGMSGDEKTARINRFRDNAINVLVSSEVGSEGIDLQFAKHEINYDLPWNPMRLEQRIGRIDRIGQKSPRIYIYNAFCENTIEDTILGRLYGRIECFRTIIGDLEEILGGIVQTLEIEVFRKRAMTEEEIEQKLRQIDHAIKNRSMMSQELEKDAGYLTAYQEHILNNIKRARDNVRRLTPEETIFTVKDFLNSNYPGSSVMKTDMPNCATVMLSDQARASFSGFLQKDPMLQCTRLNYDKQGVCCSFDNAHDEVSKGVVERVDVNHPLVKWILAELKRDLNTLSGCQLIRVSRACSGNDIAVPVGYYFYSIQNWSTEGIRRTNELHYYVVNIDTHEIVNRDIGEQLMISSLLNGQTLDIGELSEVEYEKALDAMDTCWAVACREFNEFNDERQAQNKDLISQQKLYVERTTSRKLKKLEGTLGQLIEMKKGQGVIKMWQGKIDKVLHDLEMRRMRFDDKMNVQSSIADVALGIIRVEE